MRASAPGWRTIWLLAVAALAGLILLTVAQSRPASAHYHWVYLSHCPSTVVEGGRAEVHAKFRYPQDDRFFQVWWLTEPGTADSSDYVHLENVHQRAPTGWDWMRVYVETKEDNLAEGNETFTVRIDKPPLAAIVAGWTSEVLEGSCEITIIDNDPGITDLEITSSPASGDTYRASETIEISATFSTEVDVDGYPALGLQVGDNWRGARYVRGSGSNTLVFGYTVQPADRDADGIGMHGGWRDSDGQWHNFLNHTAITAVGTDVVAYRKYSGFSSQSGHKVNGQPHITDLEITSSPASGDTYRSGETIEISATFSTRVDVDGNPGLGLQVGSHWRGARYVRGSGSNTLVFGYTVQSVDRDADGMSMHGGWRDSAGQWHNFLSHTAVTAAGTDVVVDRKYAGLSSQSGHKINGQPYPKAIRITSTPTAKTDTYGRDEVIQVSIDFDQNVTAGDDVFAILEIAPALTQARAGYASGNGSSTLVFEYTVLENDKDSNGVDAFVPYGLDIKATGTDVAYQPNPGGATQRMGEDSNHKVDGSLVTTDTTSPTISSLSIADSPGPGDDGAYSAGEEITVVVTFSESVLATGWALVEINIGGEARTARHLGLSTGATDDIARTMLVFIYTVQEGDSDIDGVSIGANKVSLKGGSIKDEAGNAAVLTHDAVADDIEHRVGDIAAPTVSSVAFTSDPTDDTYGVGDVIQITVTFSEGVTVTGTPQVQLDMYESEPSQRYASYSSSASGAANVVFEYTVTGGDSASDGLAIEADSLNLNGGAIQDEAGNDAALTHGSVRLDNGHKVSAPVGGL